MIKILDSCVECGACASNCPVEAISQSKGAFVVNTDRCIECKICIDNCPVEAVIDD